MRRILLLPGLLLLVASGVMAQSENKPLPWKRYTVSREEFSVMMPAHPAMSTRKPLVMRLGKERQQRVLGAYADGLAFTVLCFENSSPREKLDDFLEQEIFSHSGWDRVSEREITLNGFTGKQYLSPNKIPGTMQIFATRNHIYRFQAFGATTDDPRVKHFFSTIILGSKTDGIEVKDGSGVPYKPDAATATQAIENALTLKDVDRRPLIVMKPEPSYTEEARQNQIVGSVILKAVFAADGTITNIKVAASLPYGLEENSVEATKKIRFIPAVKDGKFVSTWMQLEYNFDLY
jgi:TonB family protein